MTAEVSTETMVIQVMMHEVIGVLLVTVDMIILGITDEQAKAGMIQKVIIVVQEMEDMIIVDISGQVLKVGL
ncbi:MAG: hypothetical protein NC489_33175 [Ruminococcus flavefaciens]|nr:hypothetical protein [Ruminococcus flavefaciens]